MITIQSLLNLKDNYAWLLRDQASGAVGVVDPADACAVAKHINANGGRLDLILLTHHHRDHTAGTDELRERFGARVVGPRAAVARLPVLDEAVGEGDAVRLGDAVGRVLDVPGHAIGHVAYYFDMPPALFCGDTLFSLGCGRLFEGTAEELYGSLRRLAGLPAETLVCCGHEYTESNARFARMVEPDNAALAAYAEKVKALRAAGKPSVPSRMGDEVALNPFLRAPDAAAFAELRTRKDNF